MDLTKKNIPETTISRDMLKLAEDTGNVYQSVMVIAKRANQIGQELKQELNSKLEEYQSISSEEPGGGHEDSERTELSRQYERMPKPTLIAAHEYERGELHHTHHGKK